MKRLQEDGERECLYQTRSGGPNYARTDLVAMLKEAQVATIRFAEENHDLIGGAVNAAPASEETCSRQKLEGAYLGLVKVQAPMVRCSRPAFRKLCRLWGTDVSYTHMIMADSFTRSSAARKADFSIYAGEDRLVTQIASCSGPLAAQAATLLAPYCDAIDLNCGCPQRWVMKEGLGSALLQKPEVVADMLSCIRNGLSGGLSLPCVVKMRVEDDVRRSVDFARQCEAAGCGWLTVHGRTPSCSAHAPVRLDAIRTVRECVSIPVVANGGVNNPQTALKTALAAGVGGVMSATGLLANPASFYVPRDDEELRFAPQRCGVDVALEASVGRCAGSDAGSATVDGANAAWPKVLHCCPVEVISDFIRLSCVMDLPSKATSMHLLKMGGNYLSPTERVFVAQMHSSFSVVSTFQQLGLYTQEGKFRVVESVT
ncbi:putative tRNA-dihydrouridine synthase 4 [Trypanosoma conorhini]|uniref:Putative tRNA-dihydrouridine synthase 4 n=1 Tax=Trypanosoma conorhini TaxID=83891 RepID=A0A3R7PFW3_9TRYP|nr:putative tRNA-dihydrouridine synthase 4 [Trypanosoma conorhini]RNF24697.1 putative tRNA-dihydrouridine synthase 4 [Trypanosoma conorhini]